MLRRVASISVFFMRLPSCKPSLISGKRDSLLSVKDFGAVAVSLSTNCIASYV
jgi:hypothetical protein